MKTICTAALLSTILSSAIALTAHAAPGQLPLKLSDEILSGNPGVSVSAGPVNLLSFSGDQPTLESTVGRVTCDPAESQKICDLRAAAARRAWEVVQEEKTNAQATPAIFSQASSSAEPMDLLIPSGLIPVAIACDPGLSTEECARLEKRIPSNPSGPLPPTAPAPPAVPVPAPPATSGDPSPAIDPVPVTPPSVIPPPPTGDNELVKPPPKSGSNMPVIKPKAAPPVNPQPE